MDTIITKIADSQEEASVSIFSVPSKSSYSAIKSNTAMVKTKKDYKDLASVIAFDGINLTFLLTPAVGRFNFTSSKKLIAK